MATYTYRCPKCGKEEDIYLTLNKDAKIICNDCGEKMIKLLNAVPVHFKCGGFYSTDYKDKK